jgi:tripartite-type tricarboxylate transporter receptor subunit TctC
MNAASYRRRRVALGVLLCVGSALLPCLASAAGYPERPIDIVVPFPAGGGTDALARLVAKDLAERWEQPVIVENRAGANGAIGMDFVQRAKPDGYTLLAMATGPLNEGNLPRFAPISLFAAPGYVLVVHPSIKADSVAELLALARSAPGRLSYASTGGGAASHLSAELFKGMTGTDLLHVPYKGVGSALSDLLGGHVDLMFAPPQAVISQVRSGALRALAVTGTKPMAVLPQVPTLAAAGVPGYESLGWFGLMGPAGMPPDVVARLNAEIVRFLNTPEMASRLQELGGEPPALSPEAFLAFVRADNAKWARLIKEKGLVIEGVK